MHSKNSKRSSLFKPFNDEVVDKVPVVKKLKRLLPPKPFGSEKGIQASAAKKPKNSPSVKVTNDEEKASEKVPLVKKSVNPFEESDSEDNSSEQSSLYDHILKNGFTLVSTPKHIQKKSSKREKTSFLDQSFGHTSFLDQSSKHTSFLDETLAQNSLELFDDVFESDATVKVGEKQFEISCTTLNNHLAIFKRMLVPSFKEGLLNRFEVKNVSAPVFEALIKWIYTGDICNELIDDLFVVASKYSIADLKTRCSELMRESLTKENAARRLVTSCMHNDKEFEKDVMDFISKQGPDVMREIFQSTEWHSYLDIQRDAKKLG